MDESLFDPAVIGQCHFPGKESTDLSVEATRLTSKHLPFSYESMRAAGVLPNYGFSNPLHKSGAPESTHFANCKISQPTILGNLNANHVTSETLAYRA